MSRDKTNDILEEMRKREKQPREVVIGYYGDGKLCTEDTYYMDEWIMFIDFIEGLKIGGPRGMKIPRSEVLNIIQQLSDTKDKEESSL